jgi:predicted ATP-dependent endonuclease of OLD family
MFEGLASGTPKDELGEDYFSTHFEQLLQRHWAKYFGSIQAQVRTIQERGFATILEFVLGAKTRSEEVTSSTDWKVAFEKVSSFLSRQSGPHPLVLSESDFKERFQSDKTIRTIVSIVDKVEHDIDVAMEPRSKLDEIIRKLITGRKRIELGPSGIDVISEENENIGLRSLSSGEKQILRLLLEVGQADQSTLMIDEPELSMHIDWQRELIDAMRRINPETQLILATHSPEIMARVVDSRIFSIQ